MPDFDYPYDVKNLPPAPPIRLLPVADAPPSSLGWWLGSFAIGFAALNFLFLPVIWAINSVGPLSALATYIAVYLVAFLMGAMSAQPGLLAIAAVFGSGTTWRRHVIVFSVVLLLALSGAVSIFVEEKVHQVGISPGGQIWPCMLLVPILFCACQLPLWPLRSLCCWRIAKDDQSASEQAPRLSIAGIFSATAVIALSLGAVRFGRDSLSFLAGAQADSQMWWLLTGIWAAVIFTISLAVLPLFTVAIFRTRSRLLGAAGATAWSALLFVTAITITRLASGGWPFPFPWHWLAAIVAGFTVGLVVPLMVVRLYGYRLLWGRGN
jgi:hypothetical protein